MKKIIAMLFSSMMFAALTACSAGEDSSISSPRSGSFIESLCAIYTTEKNTSYGVVYSCKDNGMQYICSATECEPYTD